MRSRRRRANACTCRGRATGAWPGWRRRWPTTRPTAGRWTRWPRTAQRLFRDETGLGFAQWRQQLRLIHALERLSAGQPVAQVADALGYATPGNFIAMFKRAFGMTPGRYLRTPLDEGDARDAAAA